MSAAFVRGASGELNSRRVLTGAAPPSPFQFMDQMTLVSCNSLLEFKV